MGLFSGKKKVVVASTVYNLAGDERVDYLKTAVVGAARASTNRRSIGEILTQSYLRGPGIKFRSYGNWARSSGYINLLGQVSSRIALGNSIDTPVLISQIPRGAGVTVMLQTAEIGVPDFTYWADRYLAETYPQAINTNYIVNFDEPNGRIDINLVEGNTVSFVPADYDPAARYLYATYNLLSGSTEGPVIPGAVVTVSSASEFPSTDGYTKISEAPDGDSIREVWQMVVENGQQVVGDKITATRKTMTIDRHSASAGQYYIDTQEITVQAWSPTQVMIYKQGSGNPVLDAMFTARELEGTFLPFIPVRVNNQFLSDTYAPDILPWAKKALRKSVGGSFDKIVDTLADNESLRDIDYAYICFGATLNTKEPAARRYIYEFFQEILSGLNNQTDGYFQWRTEWLATKQANVQWAAWKVAQSNPEDPLFNTEMPSFQVYPVPPQYGISVFSPNVREMNFDMLITWTGGIETVGSGLKKPGAKSGEIWFEAGATETFYQLGYIYSEDYTYEGYSFDTTYLNWQVDEDSWRTITLYGLSHRNLIYGGKSVDITANEALTDPEDSGFIIPLQEDIFKRMPLTQSTQLTTAAAYMVVNSYRVVKQPWYTSGAFKILVIVVIIAVTIYTGGFGAAGAGVLGTNAAVGAAIGLTGTAAIVAGVVANAIAAMIITQIIMTASTAILGDKIGTIVGTIASFIAVSSATAAASGQSMSMSTQFGNLMKADNLLRLTVATSDGISNYIKASTQDILKDTQKLMQDYNEQSEDLAQKSEELFGTNSQIDWSQADALIAESPDTFFERTLMTGSDIAQMSLDMLTNYADITLSTELPT